LGVTAIDIEAEYNNRARVPEHPAIIEGWAREAALYRATAPCELGVAYGAGEREKYDVFAGENPDAPAAVFIHGGYWQALDRSFFSHMARGARAHGVTVVVPSYDLCPHVTLDVIVEEMRALCRHVATRFGRPIAVAGHSAGGHLACCMLATEWGGEGPVVGAALSISGLPELEPLLSTSINGALRLGAATARSLSPRYWPPPAGRAIDLVVGENESSEYHRQSRELAEAWGEAGVTARYGMAAGANHFTAVAPLTDPSSAMTGRLVELARFSSEIRK
jgi:arylformamidase